PRHCTAMRTAPIGAHECAVLRTPFVNISRAFHPMAVRKHLSFSPFLLESMEILRNRRRYRTLSEYAQGLVRYDAQTQRDHTLSSEWASLNPRAQSFLA